MQNNDNPFHPIQINDYPKLFDYVVTAKGLVYLQKIKRKYYLQKKLTLDESNKLRLLYIYYASDNRNAGEVSMWKKLCINLDEKGFPEENMFSSKQELIQQSLIIKNPNYVEGLYKTHIDFIKKSKL